jgi:hypothetical protein
VLSLDAPFFLNVVPVETVATRQTLRRNNFRSYCGFASTLVVLLLTFTGLFRLASC